MRIVGGVSFPRLLSVSFMHPNHRKSRCIPQRAGWYANQRALMLLRQESDKRRPATTSRPLLSVPAPHLIRLGFPYSDLRKSLFKIGDQIVGVFQADGQSNQIGGHLKRSTCHGGVGHGARMAYARNRPRHIRRCLVHVLSSGWPKILSLSTSINHVMFVFSKADNNSFACTGN